MLFLSAICASAQQYITPVRTDILPTSPQTAAVIEQQVPKPSLLTGAVDFSVPLYTIELDRYTLPLSLNYRTNGIKFYDDPGVIGYGWTLQPALRVSRTIMGRADEKTDNVAEQLKNPSDMSRWEYAYKCISPHVTNPFGYDSQPDIFKIALPDKVLTRVYDKSTDTFVGMGDSEYTVRTGDKMETITVLAPDGVKYTFGENKGAHEYIKVPQTGIDSLYISWLLSEIELTRGRVIKFKWSERKCQDMPMIEQKTYLDGHGIRRDLEFLKVIDAQSKIQPVRGSYENLKKLQSISFGGSSVQFVYKTIAYDGVHDADFLRRIAIVAPDNSWRPIEIMRGQDYKDINLLKNIHLSDKDVYTFDYNSTRFNNITQHYGTEALCYPVDWWGYYNNAPNLSFSIPVTFNEYDRNGPTGNKHRETGINREINVNAMKANILESITYPGGGRCTFTYDVHTFPTIEAETYGEVSPTMFSRGGGLRVNRVEMFDSDGESVGYRDYDYSSANVRAVPSPASFFNVHKGFSSYSTFNSGLQGGIYDILPLRQVDILPFSDYMKYDIGETELWYSTVTEKYPEGKIIYNFTDAASPHNDIDTGIFGRRAIKSLNRISSNGPQLTVMEVYKADGGNYALVKKDKYEYESLKSDKVLSGVFIEREYIQIRLDGQQWTHAPDFKNGKMLIGGIGGAGTSDNNIRWALEVEGTSSPLPYKLTPYTISLYTERLKSKTTTFYSGGEYTESEIYQYISPQSGKLRKVVRAKGAVSETTELQYVDDKQSENILWQEMTQAHVLDRPLYEIRTRGGATTTFKAEYVKTGLRRYMPKRILTLRDGTDTIVSARYTYDLYGNLSSVTDADGCVTSFAYGFDSRFPVYKIDGMSVASLASVGNILDGHAEAVDFTAPSGTLATRLHYKPLFGVAARTEPWGRKTIYEYDTYGRLVSTSIDGKGVAETYSYEVGDGSVITTERRLNSAGSQKHNIVKRYDGIGRLIQETDNSASWFDGNLIYPGTSVYTNYDKMGRVREVSIPSYGRPGDFDKWMRFSYDASPLSYTTTSHKAGHAWASSDKVSVESTVVNGMDLLDRCHKFLADDDGTITYDGKLAAGSMMMKRVCDEEGIYNVTLTDFAGNIIEERYVKGGMPHCVYYVYDKYDRLRYILPPTLSAKSYAADDADLLEYAYRYDYDSKDRIIKSKVPGAEASYFVYTPAGRLVAESNPMLPAGKWRIHLYDAIGREVLSGLASLTDADRQALAEKAYPVALSDGTSMFYDISHVPGTADFTPEIISIYDCYPEGITSRTGTFENGSVAGSSYLAAPAGLLAATVDYDDNGVPAYTSMFYDSLGQMRQSRTISKLRTHIHSIGYNYAGAVSVEEHTASTFTSATHTLKTRYHYDDAERLKLVGVSVDGGKEGLIEYIYAACGKPSVVRSGWRSKKANPDGAISILGQVDNYLSARHDYSYNEQGWPTKTVTTLPMEFGLFVPDISSGFYRAAALDSIVKPDLDIKLRTRKYTEEIFYADGDKPRYNGTASAHKSSLGGRYDYTFDVLDRLSKAVYTPDSLHSTEDFSTAYSYDRRGRPTAITRYGVVSRISDDETFGILDKLTITYDGMHLKSVTSDLDAVEGVDFYGRTGWAGSLKELNVNGMSYNSAGMLSSDGSRGLLMIDYNSNGLPTAFRANTRNPVHTLTQTYSAAGVRLSQKEEMKYIDRRMVFYNRRFIGPFTFDTDTLERVDFAGGYFDGKGGVHFYHSDWQGNVTMVTDGHGQLEQHNGYYPYGEPWREPKGQHSRLFAGKERFEGLAKGTYDFGPRHHYPALAQWTGIDRLGHRNPRFNTYVFCAANPIKNIDPSGNDIVVLLADNNMHLAALVQHEDEQFYYYSINGVNQYYPIIGFVGGRKFDDIGVGPFNSPEAFFQSYYNRAGDKDDVSSNYYGFSEGYRIPTSREQDKSFSDCFERIASEEEYRLLWNNCATTVHRSLEAAGVEGGVYEYSPHPMIGNPRGTTNYEDAMYLPYFNYIFPKDAFQSIMRANKNGIYLKY